MTPAQRIILALDRPRLQPALELLDSMPPALEWVKVGLELFTAEGPAAVAAVRERNKRVFLDLKLHDIPNTVSGAVRAAGGLGAELLTLHAAGGPAMMEAAVQARDEANPDLKLLGITVLTSLDGSEFPEVYAPGSVADRVGAFARASEAAGLDGVVCSPRELEPLGSVVSPTFLRVTPGIRLARGDAHDQRRVASPGAALAAGATHLVVGRALTAAENPQAAWDAVVEDLG